MIAVGWVTNRVSTCLEIGIIEVHSLKATITMMDMLLVQYPGVEGDKR